MAEVKKMYPKGYQGKHPAHMIKAVIVSDNNGGQAAIIPTKIEGCPIYQKIGEFIDIYAKGEKSNNVNAALSTFKKIKRQIDAEKAQNDQPRIVVLLQTQKEISDTAFAKFSEKRFDSVAEEQLSMVDVLEKLLNTLKAS